MSESILNKVVTCPICRKRYVPFYEGDDDMCDECIAQREVVEREDFNDERSY